jgi:hypothetical protein
MRIPHTPSHAHSPRPQAVHINQTVVALPADALSMVATLNTTLAALDGIYKGEEGATRDAPCSCGRRLAAAPVASDRPGAAPVPRPFPEPPRAFSPRTLRPFLSTSAANPSPLTLARNLTDLRSLVALPANASDLRSKAAAAASALDAAAPLTLDLRGAIDNMRGLLTRLGPAHDAIAGALTAYIHSGGSWGALYGAITSGADKVVLASSAVAIANAQAAPSAAARLRGVTDAVAAYGGDRAAVAAAAGGAVKAIDAVAGASGFLAGLDAVAPAYASLGTPPSKVRAATSGSEYGFEGRVPRRQNLGLAWARAT